MLVAAVGFLALGGCKGGNSLSPSDRTPDSGGDGAESTPADAATPDRNPAMIDGAGGGDALHSSDAGACHTEYQSPGCGSEAAPVCTEPGADVPAIALYYCNCSGKTIWGGANGADEPFQLRGCCPGETGFGMANAYACPADGGIPYYVGPEDAGGADSVANPEASLGGLDGGPRLDGGDGGACSIVYASPGCGSEALPVCWQPGDGAVPAIGIYYCNCSGKTIEGSVLGADEPFQLKGCCPGDTGFGPLHARSCPADGGIPY